MISITSTAAAHIQAALSKRGKGIGLRLGTRSSGCSGLSYVVEFCDVVTDDDTVIDQHGVKVVVDYKSMLFLDGTEVDYVKKGLSEGFEFSNPNTRSECGCGESFNV